MNYTVLPDQPLVIPEFEAAGVHVSIRRYDLIHPEASGNKLFKLNYWLQPVRTGDRILSFGGAFSNHLLALAAVGQRNGFHTIGVIRGERPAQLNAWLNRMEELGMQLQFISREKYKLKEEESFQTELTNRFNTTIVIPEGGAGIAGVSGASEMVSEDEPYDWIILPGGTGTTVAGIAKRLQHSTCNILCFQVLKGKGIIRSEVFRTTGMQLEAFPNLTINDEFHSGGYAKYPDDLRDFHSLFADQTRISLDRVYGIKAMKGLLTLARTGFFKSGTRVLYLHTGGNGPVNQRLSG